jgi:hypothetical protein
MVHTQARRSVSYGQRGPHDTLLCHTTAASTPVEHPRLRASPETGIRSVYDVNTLM